MPQPSPQTHSRTGSCVSNTTYYSFDNTEPHPQPALHVHRGSQATQQYEPDNASIASAEMHRQDSGYESLAPRDPLPRSRTPCPSGRKSSSTTSSRPGSRTRPPARRPATSGPISRAPKSKLGGRSSLLLTPSNPVSVRPASYYGYADSTNSSPYNPHANAQSSYFYFPPPQAHPQPQAQDVGDYRHSQMMDDAYMATTTAPHRPASPAAAVYDGPPQTTHYWTSDHTRRLEYAAIDAASRGVRGWLMRHMVPDCFVPKAKRRVAFDDDTGSVRRYRLELDESDDVSGGNRPNAKVQKKRVTTF